MHIVVLGGSPKGSKSVTIQYVNYIKEVALHHSFSEYYPSANIKEIESDIAVLQSIIDDIQRADAVL